MTIFQITNAFNKQSPNKRSLNVLRTKFDNMKRLGRKMGFMHKKDDKKSTIGYTKVEKDDLEMLQVSSSTYEIGCFFKCNCMTMSTPYNTPQR